MSYSAYKPSPLIISNEGAIGSTLVRKFDVLQSVANILAFPFLGDTLDLTGNHTIDDGTATLGFSSWNGTYDGNNMLDVDNVALSAPRIIASSQAHQIPHSKPVTFGFFMMPQAYHSTAQLMNSGPGGNTSNYGIQRQPSVGWRYQGSGVSNLGDHRDITPANRWIHICLAIDSTSRGGGSNPAEFYINGVPVWSGVVGSAQPVSSTDDFGFTADADETTPSIDGWMCNCFVTDTVLDRATIKALSDESYGHASPFNPSEIP